MSELTILLSDELKTQAELAARSNGVSLDQFVKHCIAAAVDLRSRAADPFLSDRAKYTGDSPCDLSENHDDYLYGEDA